jgi:hypothetical protein
MRYDDIEAHKSIVSDNLELANTLDSVSLRIEKLSNNPNLKYLNFKVIGGSLAAGLVVGALSMIGFAYYKVKTAPVVEKIVEVEVEKIVEDKSKIMNLSDLLEKTEKKLKKFEKRYVEKMREKKAIIKKLQAKILPSDYYCSLTDGRKGICIYRYDERYDILESENEEDSNQVFIELK